MCPNGTLIKLFSTEFVSLSCCLLAVVALTQLKVLLIIKEQQTLSF